MLQVDYPRTYIHHMYTKYTVVQYTQNNVILLRLQVCIRHMNIHIHILRIHAIGTYVVHGSAITPHFGYTTNYSSIIQLLSTVYPQPKGPLHAQHKNATCRTVQ